MMKNNDFSHLETPSFLLNKKQFDEGLILLEKALKNKWNNYKIGYSVKTNNLPWLIHRVNQLGHFLEVVSPNEYQLVKKMGVLTDKIIYNGPIKTKASFLEAIKEGAIVNIDSYQELSWILEDEKTLKDSRDSVFSIGVRVNFDLMKTVGKTGLFSRFGFSYENGELLDVLDKLKACKHYKIDGLHLHFSTSDRAVKNYQAISKIACEISKEYNLELNYIDIGGGFFGGLDHKPSFDEYMTAISDELSQFFSPQKTTLIVEPGTSVLSKPFKYICRVIDVKKIGDKSVIVTDGSRTDIDPLMSKSNYMLDVLLSNKTTNVIDEQLVVGFTCMENDRIVVLRNHPKLSIGDILLFNNIGAYTMCLSPNFIQYGTKVYLNENNQYRLIRDTLDIANYIKANGVIE